MKKKVSDRNFVQQVSRHTIIVALAINKLENDFVFSGMTDL